MTNPQAVKIDGPSVTFGGREYVLAPLNLRALKNYPTALANVSSDDWGKRTEAFAQLMHASLSRNYPEITLDKVLDEVEVGDMLTLTRVLMDASGLVRRTTAPGGAPSEDPLIGTPSTATSSPPPDGAGSTSTST